MEAIFFLVPLSMILVFAAIGIFVWSVKNGQYDDLDKEAWRILDEDETDTENSRGKP